MGNFKFLDEKRKRKEDVCACGKNEVWWERKEKINKTKTILIIKEDMYCVGVCLVVSTYIIILTMMGSCYVYCLVGKKIETERIKYINRMRWSTKLVRFIVL